eukprot:727134_1
MIWSKNGLNKIAAEIRERRQRFNAAEAKIDGKNIRAFYYGMVPIIHWYLDNFEYNDHEKNLLYIIRYFWIRAAEIGYVALKTDVSSIDLNKLFDKGRVVLMVLIEFIKPENIKPSDIRFWMQLTHEMINVYRKFGHGIYVLAEESMEGLHGPLKEAFYAYVRLAPGMSALQFTNKIREHVQNQWICEENSNTSKWHRKNKNEKEKKKCRLVRREGDKWCCYCRGEEVEQDASNSVKCKYCNVPIVTLMTELEESLMSKGYPQGVTNKWKTTYTKASLHLAGLEKELAALDKRSAVE